MMILVPDPQNDPNLFVPSRGPGPIMEFCQFMQQGKDVHSADDALKKLVVLRLSLKEVMKEQDPSDVQ